MKSYLFLELPLRHRFPSALKDQGSVETSHARSRERYRRAVLSGSANLIAKGMWMGTSLMTVRLAFQYLGAERCGMWMTISSIVMMFGSADLGMANGLVNQIADAHARGHRVSEKQASASAFWMLLLIASILAVGMIAAYPLLNIPRILNVHSSLAIHECGPTFLIFFYCFLLNLPLGTVRGVQTGLQKGFLTSLWMILGVVFYTAALLISVDRRASLPILVLSLNGAQLLATVLNAIYLFAHSHPELMPHLKNFSRSAASRLFRTGIMYFLLQMSFTIGMQTDNVVIAQVLGAGSVADYAVPARLFNVLVSFSAMAGGTMWPAYTEAMARSDKDWVIRGYLMTTACLVAINLGGALILLFLGNRIIGIWIGHEIKASAGLLLALGAMCVTTSFVNSTSILLNGLNKFRAQVVFGLLMAMVNLPLSVFFVRRFGIIGAVLGTLIAQIVVQVSPMFILAKKSLNELSHVRK